MNRDKFSFFTTPFKLITLIYSFVKKTKNHFFSDEILSLSKKAISCIAFEKYSLVAQLVRAADC